MEKIIAHYIWLDGKQNLRYKTKVQIGSEFSNWNADGSSTFQAGIECSEIIIKPVKSVKINPKYFNATHNYNQNIDVYIVLCDTYGIDDKPLKSNKRYNALEIFNKHKEQEIMFGLEQEYYIVDAKTKQPKSFVYDQIQNGMMESQNYHYCYLGIHENIGRIISEEHMYACIDAGLTISGINAEVGPHQWEFQIGPVIGIDAADQLIIANFLLMKIAEKYEKHIVYLPKPFGEKISGSGCHTNVSTKAMREDGGYDVILKAMDKLKETCEEAVNSYGEKNKERLSGKCETASWDKFSYSVGGRDVSVRIGYETAKNGKGYFEDRRPGANLEPYMVTSYITKTICE